MAEEANDVATTEVVDAAEPTAEVESSTTEQTTEVTQEENQEVQEESESEAEVTAEAETDSTESAEETLKPKSENRFQKLANENRNLKEQIKQLEALQVPTEEDYIDSGMTQEQAEVAAIKASLQQRDAVDSVVHLNQSVENDLERTMREYPQLDPESKQFNEKLAASVMAQYDRDSGAEYDPNSGIMIRTSQLPYEYIKDKMELISMASAQAKVEAQKNVESMVANSDTPSSQAPSFDPKTETIEQMRERLASVTF